MSKNPALKLLDFYAPWCQPCKQMEPVLEEIEKEYPTVEVVKINTDDNPKYVEEYKIMSIPTYIITRDDEELKRSTGFTSKSVMKKYIEDILNP